VGNIRKAALKGAAFGLAGSAVLFLIVQRYTLANDWFVVVLFVFGNTTAFAIAAHYRVNLLGVVAAGVAGLFLGAWIGDHTIGSYEHTVPIPPEQRIWRLSTPDGRVRELTDPREETVKRIPIGSHSGALLGWIAAAVTYGWLLRRWSLKLLYEECATSMSREESHHENRKR